jgi:hypothetical protein
MVTTKGDRDPGDRLEHGTCDQSYFIARSLISLPRAQEETTTLEVLPETDGVGDTLGKRDGADDEREASTTGIVDEPVATIRNR